MMRKGKSEVNQEIIFAKALEDVRELAKEQGNRISEEQVMARFAQLKLTRSQMEMVFDYLTNHNIGIGEPIDANEFLTEEERDDLHDYLRGIAFLPVYTEGQREAYAMSVMAGDVMARQYLIESYLRIVADIARVYAGQGVALEDLIGEGNVALAMTVEMLAHTGRAGAEGSFPEQTSRLPGSIVGRIMDAMEACIRERAASEKTDRKIADKVNQVADKARELAEALHRKVTPEELKAESGLSLKEIQDAMRMSGFQIEDIEVKTESTSG